jgi:hypothetical protein
VAFGRFPWKVGVEKSENGEPLVMEKTKENPIPPEVSNAVAEAFFALHELEFVPPAVTRAAIRAMKALQMIWLIGICPRDPFDERGNLIRERLVGGLEAEISRRQSKVSELTAELKALLGPLEDKSSSPSGAAGIDLGEIKFKALSAVDRLRLFRTPNKRLDTLRVRAVVEANRFLAVAPLAADITIDDQGFLGAMGIQAIA